MLVFVLFCFLINNTELPFTCIHNLFSSSEISRTKIRRNTVGKIMVIMKYKQSINENVNSMKAFTL